MPALGLLAGSVLQRYPTTLPSLPLVNMFAEKAITEPKGFALVSRPPLSEVGEEYGTGPIRALYQNDGVLSNVIIALSSDDLYVDGTNEGTVPGSGAPSLAGNEIGVIVVCAGDDVKFYDGTTFRSVTFPDSAKVRKVLESQGRFVFLRDASQRYYWTKPLSNMISAGNIVIDALAYASAEFESDRNIDGLFYGSTLVLGGTKSIELHVPSGDENAPWTPLVGATIPFGVYDTGCMTLWNGTFAWISQDGVVMQNTGAQPAILSTPGVRQRIVDAISISGNLGLDSFFWQEQEFLRVKTGTTSGDLLLSAQTGEWCSWTSVWSGSGFLGGPVIPGLAADFTVPAGPIFGSNLDGNLLGFDPQGIGTGELASTFTRQFRCGLPIDGGSVTFNNVVLRCSVGVGQASPTGYSAPVISMRYSRDAGQSWTSYIDVSLGADGTDRAKVEWRSLGIMDQPGFLADFKVENAVQFHVSGAYYNEPMNGRSRG